jgi:DNA-binding helix-hairpin-helix protein with protein kinase domain
MVVYTGKTGKTYTRVEPFLGKGGEGAVYAIAGMPDYVLKIYLQGKATETKHRKLLAMLNTKMPESAIQQITWPVDIVYENGKIAGYVMPKLTGTEELNVMYSDKYRCTLLERLTIARNLCVAVNTVHEAGQVCGDLNPKNIAVNPGTAKVKLVDTDSYHITDEKSKVYRCEVGLPEYLPGEIQVKMKDGYTLATAPLPTFSKSSDLFALAVHIFALLMNGCHPFSCAVNSDQYNIARLAGGQPSVAAPQPIENICSGYFPFFEKRHGITIPKYAPELSMLPQEIQELFIKAFVYGHKNPEMRPDAVMWYRALIRMQQNLTICRDDSYHMYPRMLTICPWCMIEKRMSEVSAVPAIQTIPPELLSPNYGFPIPPSTSAPYTPNSTAAGKKPAWLGVAGFIAGGITGFFAGIIIAALIYIVILVISVDGFMYGLNAPILIKVLTVMIIGTTLFGAMYGWAIGTGKR